MTDPIRIDERNYVEKPLLDQLAGLGWEIIDLDNKQHPDGGSFNRFVGVCQFKVRIRHGILHIIARAFIRKPLND